MKRIKKFNESVDDNKTLLYYALDFDDNILFMPTVIHMDKLVDGEWVPEDVSTSDFALVRGDKVNWRLHDNDPDKAFCEFRDFGPRGDLGFLEDIKKAVSLNRFGPSWDDFIECLVNGSLFSIITARGHEPDTIRKGVEWILDNVLTDDQVYEMHNNLIKFSYIFKNNEEGTVNRILRTNPSNDRLIKQYLDSCEYVGVSAPSRGGNTSQPEKDKEIALMEFKQKINDFANNVGYKAVVGFSDDDLGNVKHVEELVDSISHEQFPNIVKYVVKNTKNPDNVTKKVRFVETANQAPGLESSVLPFTQFNNMTNKLYPQGPDNRQNDFANKNRRETDYLAKTSEEIFGKEGKKKKKKGKEKNKPKQDEETSE